MQTALLVIVLIVYIFALCITMKIDSKKVIIGKNRFVIDESLETIYLDDEPISKPPIREVKKEEVKVDQIKPHKPSFKDDSFLEIVRHYVNSEGMISKKDLASAMKRYNAYHTEEFTNGEFMLIYGNAYLCNSGVRKMRYIKGIELVIEDHVKGSLYIKFNTESNTLVKPPKVNEDMSYQLEAA